ncbi:MAG: hypothetical protein K5859_05565 [Atopobiaceae bacterium]|nr:hypothetical protein [Atopobiaceae bacterium]
METLGAQLNVRMGAALKERGDAGLASIGLTASEAVRALWELASSGAQNLAALQRLLADAPAASPRAEVLDAGDPLSEGKSLYAAALSQLGLEAAPVDAGVSDKELLQDALLERLDEKGLA